MIVLQMFLFACDQRWDSQRGVNEWISAQWRHSIDVTWQNGFQTVIYLNNKCHFWINTTRTVCLLA
jgi:hypothetical protein